MEKKSKEEIESIVLQDLEFVNNFWPLAPEAKSAKHFEKMTIIKPIALNSYPQIYADLVQRFEIKEAAMRLKRLGLRETKFLYASLPEMLTSPQKFYDIFTDFATSHFGSKLSFEDKIEEDHQLKSCKIIVHDCFFCSEITVFEAVDIPYCIPNCGVFENLYNIKSLYRGGLIPRLIRIDPIKSAEFDGDTCIYELVVLD